MTIKNYLTSLLCIFLITALHGQQKWIPVNGRIMTPWADKVNPESPLPEYPRPQLQRDLWWNLNGLWDYSIQPSDASRPSSFQGKILVPFSVESALSGVGKTVGKENKLWYRRTVKLPSSFNGKNVLLNFGAVDWKCEVFINNAKAGEHTGGYDPFSFNVTKFLKKGDNEIVISVYDPSDDGPQPRGKQVKNPNSIWYTPVTGIWQTVWVEAVPETYIVSTVNTPDFDSKQLKVMTNVANLKPGDKVVVTIFDGTNKIANGESNEKILSVNITSVRPWTPQEPKIYPFDVAIVRKGKTIDKARSYFALRKISVGTDANGYHRMMLNNQFLFQYGPLDQGWWPDGLYTAPTDEALKFDIEKTKAMGFNLIRKHVKVEPARWYYYCDILGMLVWQDMPSGDMGNHWDSRPGILGIATDKERTAESESIFKSEWKAIMNATYNFPSIVVWVPFNEAWGQFKTAEIVKMTKELDSTRLIASGGNYSYTGDILDLHNYPSPSMPDPKFFKNQVIVLGEFGGLGLPLEGHTWQLKDNWGYQSFPNETELFNKYAAFITGMPQLIKNGLSAAVYTQTTDVEIEVNGLMTYDRKVIKMPAEKLNEIHRSLYNTAVK